MGNSQSDEGIIKVRSEIQLRDGSGHIVSEDDDDEVMVALASTPSVPPLITQPSLEEIDSLFDAAPILEDPSEEEVKIPPELKSFDSFTVMRMQVAWQTHVRNASRRAAAQQTKLQDKLCQCDKRATNTLTTMQEHTLIITDFVALLPHINTMVTDVRYTRVRLQLITEAAQKLEKVMDAIEKHH